MSPCVTGKWRAPSPSARLAGIHTPPSSASPGRPCWTCGARGLGVRVAGEAFADRRYDPDGTLRSRQFADALITDPREAAAQARRFARQGLAETICVHGDTPGSVEILKSCRQRSEEHTSE